MKKLAKFYIVLTWTFFVFVLIATPMAEYNGNQVSYYDKFAHIILFGVFNLLFFYFLLEFKKIRIKYKILISLSLSIFYASLCEYVQLYVPGRDTSELDFFAGFFGALIVSIYLAKIHDKIKS